MKKTILGLAAARPLSRKEQQSVMGGIHRCAVDGCPPGYYCHKTGCKTYPPI